MNKFRLLILSLLVSITVSKVSATEINRQGLYNLAEKSKSWLEGFQKNTGQNAFSYHNFRTDVTEGMITRCSDGTMAIEWETQTLQDTFTGQQAGFLWIASVNRIKDPNIFDVFVNGVKRFEIVSSLNKEWEVTSADGGKLSFTTVQADDQEGNHGYMSLIAPASWLKKGVSQKISITGRANKNNVWVIVYQASDALSYLQNSLKYDLNLKLEASEKEGSLECRIIGDSYLNGNEISFSSLGKTKKIQLKQDAKGSLAVFNLPLKARNKPFTLSDLQGEIIGVTSFGEATKSTRFLNKAVLSNQSSVTDGRIIIEANRTYDPNTVAGLFTLSNSILGKGQILLMNSSHQDIAWMDSPEKCVIERDTMLLTPLFRLAGQDKNYRFDIEDALMIREFFQRHPDKKPLLKQMFADGRLSCGSTFIQPYEEMYSGEALARQFYFGAKWLKDEFNYDATVYWNEDVPGRTLQMAQLMRKAGTKSLMISRHNRGIFNWYSPDGSYVTVFSPGHYGDAFMSLNRNFNEAAQFISKTSMDWEKFYTAKSPSPVIPILSDWDMSPSKDYSHLINNWENIHELPNEQGKNILLNLPRFKVATTPEFFESLLKQNPQLPVIKGERPAVWLYIHGPSHQKALKASREADILLTIAEKFSAINSIIDGSFTNYPQTKLTNAWEAKIFPDHGWGGKHGDITDAFFQSKYEFAKSEAEKIVDKSLNELASKIKTNNKKGRPVVVFNSMNQSRTDKVVVPLNFNKAEIFGIELIDISGKALSTQLGAAQYYEDGSIKSADLHFLADTVPSIGFTTYYLKNAKKTEQKPAPEFRNQAENKFYRITFGDGGLTSVYDKELGEELIDGGKFKAGEVFTMHSEGNGAGEFADIQKPDMKDFDKTGNYQTKWEIEEDGPVFTKYKFRQHIKFAVIQQHIKVFHDQKRIDFEPEILNWEGVLYHEYRMALPLNMTDGKVAYEVPFGVVEVGKDEIQGAAGERYRTECKNVHPRGIQNWIGSDNSRFGVTLSSSVVVADWIDPTDNPIKNQVLQPILLASRKSCHWEGNDYLQTGNHSFSFSFTSHKPGWKNGASFGHESNEKLIAVLPAHRFDNASLPESCSFFKTNGSNIIVSTIKKGEDSDCIIIRVAEMEGKEQEIVLQSFRQIKNAKHTSLIEADGEPINSKESGVTVNLGHNAIETVKISF